MSADKPKRADLASIVQTNESKLRKVANALVRDTAEAQDLVQDSYVTWLEALEVDAAIESAGAWLVTVVRNKVIDRFRRKRTQKDYEESAAREEAPLLLGDPGQDPEESSWSAELRELLLEALLALPEEQREAFVGHELEGKSFEEMSREKGVPVNTLIARKRYAVLFLREYLEEVYNELD